MIEWLKRKLGELAETLMTGYERNYLTDLYARGLLSREDFLEIMKETEK